MSGNGLFASNGRARLPVERAPARAVRLRRAVAFTVAFAAAAPVVSATDYYVSANRGGGKKGTLEKPAKSIGNLVSKLEAGDTVHVAQGEYPGKSDCGWVEITVPVNIIGGYNDDFTARDPWGAHRTVLVGENKSDNYKNAARLRVELDKWNRAKDLEFLRAGQNTRYDVVVDGIIVDNAGRNRYREGGEALILRKADPKTGANPTPDVPGIAVDGSLYSTVTVQNCVVLNCASTQGALTVTAARGGTAVVSNNLVINNTGVGIFARAAVHTDKQEEVPRFVLEQNTVLFTEKYDAYGTIGGCAFQMDAATDVTATRNVFAFSDTIGVNNPVKSSVKVLTLAENLLYANLVADMVEFDTKMPVDSWEDDSDDLSDDSEGNVGESIEVPTNPDWSELYLARAIIDRNAAEADVKAAGGVVNELRSILGLPLQAPDLKLDSDVWLPRMSVDDALRAGMDAYRGQYGCSRPSTDE